MLNLPGAFNCFPLEEIVEKKLLLKKLKPFSESLTYITLCWDICGASMAQFNFKKDAFLRKKFEEYTGISRSETRTKYSLLSAYNNALEKEISKLIAQ